MALEFGGTVWCRRCSGEGQQGGWDNKDRYVVEVGFEAWLGFLLEGENSLIKQTRIAN